MDKSIQELLKKNIRLIDTIRFNESLDKTGIAQKMGVTWPTISGHIDALLEHNILIRQKDNQIRINNNFGYFFGISVGSAQIKICIIDMGLHLITADDFLSFVKDDDVFIEQKKYSTEREKKIDRYLFSQTPDTETDIINSINNIFSSIKTIIERHNKNILGIGIAFTGAIDKTNKKILKSFNIPCFENTSLFGDILLTNYLDFFETKGIEITIENNSIASGIAEKCMLYEEKNLDGSYNINYKYRNKQNIINIYLGAGFGLGIIQNNKLYRGSNNLSGGAGHLEVPDFSNDTQIDIKPFDTTCTCGGKNCLDYRVRTDVFKSSFEDFKKWNSNDICNYFIEHPEKKKILGIYLGHLINLISNLLNPDLIIIGGKLYKSIDDLWGWVQLKLMENNVKYTKSNCALAKSSLGPLAPAIGAAICAFYGKFDAEIMW